MRPELERAIAHALNCESAENGSNTPDFILARYLVACLAAFDEAVKTRGVWRYGDRGESPVPARVPRGVPPERPTE